MLYPTTETGSIVKLRNGKLAIKINNTFIGQKDKNGNYNTYAIDYPYIDEIEYTTRDFVQDPKTRNFNYCRKYKEDGDN